MIPGFPTGKIFYFDFFFLNRNGLKNKFTMKKILLVTALTLFSGITFSQTFEKGNLMGLHIFSLNLDPDVTFNQYKDFFIRNYIPELNRNFPDVNHYFTIGNREENKNSIGMIVVFGSQEIKNKYYNEDGSRTDLTIAIQEKIKSTREQLDSLGKVSATYTEWLVQ